jgi:hypothetical protein
MVEVTRLGFEPNEFKVLAAKEQQVVALSRSKLKSVANASLSRAAG